MIFRQKILKCCRYFATNSNFQMMAAGSTNSWQRKNGFERERVPRPFVIGVAGGTASGKVKTIIHVNVGKFLL